MNTSTLIQKVWNFCHTLRDDGVGYGDYLEQLTYLSFLEMADEYAQPPYERDTRIPPGFDWPSLKNKVGAVLESQDLSLRDDDLDDLDDLPSPDVLQQEIIEHLEAALTAFSRRRGSVAEVGPMTRFVR